MMSETRQSWLSAPPREVLIVVTRRIGDVLLALPLVESLHAAWPETAFDALVFQGTEGVMTAHPAIRRVLTIAERPRLTIHLALALRVLRRYDLALSLIPGDRPTFYAFLAGRQGAGLLVDRKKEHWKRRLLHRWVPFDNLNTHTLRMHLALADLLGVPRVSSFKPGWSTQDEREVHALLGESATAPLAVLHPYPKYRYKMWPREGWIALGRWLAQQGYRVVLTGSRDPAEMEYVTSLRRELPADTLCAAGRLSIGGSGCLVSGARLYVGPDTAMTHIAAALGVPTVALFGPSNPVKWGPWPRDHPCDTNPWRRCGSQRVGNVILLQGSEACVPCLLEGCDRHVESVSDCLAGLPVAKVQRAIEALLGKDEAGRMKAER
ncbi:MAG TPA: glycosyltransferase family 9 protein [Burkholderiales bacterium]|nr:glycosyltransferase family 9 protein [Burkholderiales bacterium]